MKKLIFVGALACIAFGFSACSNQPACYELTGKLGSFSTTVYTYTTSNAIQQAIDAADPSREMTWTWKRVSKAQNECYGIK